ncbi:sigma-54-dependent Fis family transcriptional regulator [Undibacterium sp. Ren11W]|uniref:sigma-54-dependent Fis family transcriptional regulator n=1 Tax=Undibacterium sp. Ren11W TaxID=3413045 RepID=UPI003BF41D2A
MPTPLPALTLRQARLHLQEYGHCPSGTINERLLRSWQRSLAAGLQPVGGLRQTEHASGDELRQVLERNHDLLSYSRPVMEYLFESVRDSQSVVVLADNRGTLMHTLGDAGFLNKAERVALASGASWHEDHRGTNAIGTALAETSEVEIHGAEHFLERNGFLTCAAAPIMAADGSLMGILDISGDRHSGHPHTLNLVSMAVRMIENRLIVAGSKRHIRLHFHAHPEGIATIAEGIVVLSEDGWIVGANRVALSLLHLGAHQLGAVQITSVLNVRLEHLLHQHSGHALQTITVHSHDGTRLAMQVHLDHSVLPAVTSASSAAVSSQPAAEDALSLLDSGDPRWRSAAEKTRRILDKPIPLIVQGESGVGKEFFAKAAHDSGPRRNGPFVAINCAAIPENLIEAELFGYQPGAFTGARREGSLGRLREANGGTLFLDEIGDMPLPMQSRLLRVLQERSVTPLGGGKTVAVDFALICATHCKLREQAEQGKFRYDLYYRINGLTVQLPALRERSDFLALTTQILRKLSPQRELHLTPGLFAQLAAHPWPGNLRQYSSVLRTAIAMLNPEQTGIEMAHLSDDIIEELLQLSTSNELVNKLKNTPAHQATAALAGTQNLEQLSRQAIELALSSSRGNISQAARSLGISRQTLYRKINH